MVNYGEATFMTKFLQNEGRIKKLNQIKFRVNDSQKTDKKITTNFEAVNGENVIIKAYLDTNLSKRESEVSSIEKSYNEFKLQNNKHCVEKVSMKRAVKTTIQILL